MKLHCINVKCVCLGLFLLIYSFSLELHATHNRAGEITYRHISGFTFEATITTYTKPDSPADRPELIISWGDGVLDTIPRVNGGGFGETIAPNIRMNIYIGVHTYPGPSVYTISFEDPNRNAGIVNIPNSINIPFYVSTQLIINPFLGVNNSVRLLNPPIDNACAGQVFIHNAGAFDPDGDSLSYRLVQCLGEDGLAIPGFSIPQSTISFTINPITGDLIWNTPLLNGIGEYNVAFAIDEWRNGQLISSVVRDMQITVKPCEIQQPPSISAVQDYCVEAGTLLNFSVSATSPVGNVLTLSATGGPLLFEPPNMALFPAVTATNSVTGNFSWLTACNNVRRLPYQVYFKAVDNPSAQDQSLVDFKTVNIKVIAPASSMLFAEPLGNSMQVAWTANACAQAVGYKLYRRVGSSGFIPDSCVTGLPPSAGYTQVATISGHLQTNYTDNNGGAGLLPGLNYCYRVVAFFADGAESYVSDEICNALKRDIPIITNVSVEATAAQNGIIAIAWSKPKELDTLEVPGPYFYKVYRSVGLNGLQPILLDSLLGINDTTYIDSSPNLNTAENAYSYRIELINNTPNDRFLIGFTQWASSVFLNASGNDNTISLSWQETVPWINDSYNIYRFNETLNDFELIGTSDTQLYEDSGLENGVNYCYRIESVGAYSVAGLISPILNFSQEICAQAIDNEAPCAPVLTINSDCELGENNLSWTNPNNFCADDVLSYKLYFKAFINDDFTLLSTFSNPSDTVFKHIRENSVAGCYIITAIDSFMNESIKLEACVDNCPIYDLPNVFTPNGDGFNDTFRPFPYRHIESISIFIHNRWGQLMFETNDININWEGTSVQGGFCPDGVYFYVCEVNEIRLEGIKKRVLKGNIHLLNSKSGKIN